MSTNPILSSGPSPLFGVTSTLSGWAAQTAASAPPARTRPRPENLADDQIDWRRVYRIRSQVTTRLTEQAGPDVSDDDRLQIGRAIIKDQLLEFVAAARRDGREKDEIAPRMREAYEQAVEAAIFGYGRWTPLMSDPDVENIEIRGAEHTFMTYGDRVESVAPVSDSDQELLDQVAYLATWKGHKEFNRAHPAITVNLEDQWRLHATGFDISNPPSVAIRQHKLVQTSLDELSGQYGLMPGRVADLIAAAVRAGKSFVVSGPMGSGKTTLLRAMAAALPPLTSVGVIETDPELFLHKLPGHYRTINLVTRQGTDEETGPDGRPSGEIGLTELLRESKRQNLDRVVVGEILGEEAAALFEAMQSGTGSFSTIHANSAETTIERIATAASSTGRMSTGTAYRQIAGLLDFIIYIRTIDTRWQNGGRLDRAIGQIIQIDGLREHAGTTIDMPAIQTVYDWQDPDRPFNLSPAMVRDLQTAGWTE